MRIAIVDDIETERALLKMRLERQLSLYGSFIFVKISTSFIKSILRKSLCTVCPVQQIA